MRKVGKEAAAAFLGRTAYKNKATISNGDTLTLYGHKIAQHYREGILLSLAGFPTTTTLDRINCVLDAYGATAVDYKFSVRQGQVRFGAAKINSNTVIWISKSKSSVFVYKVLRDWPEDLGDDYANKSSGTGG